MKKLVIFDLDGTLLNTIDDLGEATNHALAELGFPTHQLSAYPHLVGNGVTRLIERALPEGEASPDLVKAARERFMEYYDVHKCDHTTPYAGIPELLTELRLHGVSLAVASNKYDAAVKELIAHFFPEVEWSAVEGHKTGYPTKPDPSIVFDILSKVPTPKAEVFYVGDSGIDIETARRACVDSVGVTWGFRPARELRETYANHIISTPEDLLKLL